MKNYRQTPLGVSIKGRAAISNHDHRYSEYSYERFDDGWQMEEDANKIPTRLHRDRSRTIIATNQSPDLPFQQSINPYRGCEHGCIYCFARPTHAYLGFSPGLDFETEIFYKPDAAKLLRHELAKPGYRCKVIALGTNTDPYQPVEKKLGVMRSIVEVLYECRQPFSVTTKSALIERDIDILAEMAQCNLLHVQVSITTLNDDLCRRLEPRAPAPKRRLKTIQRLSEAGIPVSVFVAPLIPVLNDAELENILKSAAASGAISAAYILLRLPLEVKDLFSEWLQIHEPDKAKHVMGLIRQCRGGKDYDPAFGSRMSGTGEYANLLKQRFKLACEKYGLNRTEHRFDASLFSAPLFTTLDEQSSQLTLF